VGLPPAGRRLKHFAVHTQGVAFMVISLNEAAGRTARKSGFDRQAKRSV